MFTRTACMIFLTHAIDKTRFIEQSATHLYGLETMVQHFVNLLSGHQSANIDQRHIERSPEFQSIFQKISFFERNSRYHPLTHHAYSVLQPPAGHVIGHGTDRHLAAHHIHRCLADKSSTQHQGMCSRLL